MNVLATHRNAPVTCRTCGRRSQRRARQQQFCSTRCREKAKERGKKTSEGGDTGAPPNPHKSASNFNVLQALKWRPSTDICGPSSVIDAELIAGREWQEAVSTAGIRLAITQLRRPALIGRAP